MYDQRASADTVRSTKQQFWYVYILSLSNGKYYTGYTQDIDERYNRHQNGMVAYTASYRPLELVYYSAFRSKILAIEFERYLKSGSGRAFTSKRLIPADR
jgi:putative endonuclease